MQHKTDQKELRGKRSQLTILIANYLFCDMIHTWGVGDAH